ncbi:uncharacterized protein LOC116010760 [Ipomoea triloba]|uniref:uncharacterized protein LOC116010760 n=1 Tax=Ipomoea triloba TaxID=35885 RepID=UPI00125CDBF8|nr:uncharacterized protein LOC116010760 [Ipomoea triloba]
MVAQDGRPCWQLVSVYLPTRDALNLRHVHWPLTCHMCRTEDESAFHLFVQCREAVNIWNKLCVFVSVDAHNVSEWVFECINILRGDLLAKFVVACWVIWNSRNDHVWKVLPIDVNHMLRSAFSFLENWKTANDLPVIGWVLRYDDGRFFAAKNICMPGSFTVKETEALLLNTGMGSVDVEMDSQIVFNVIHSFSFNSAFGLLVDDVKELTHMIGDVNIHFVKRSANCTARTVALEAFSVTSCGEWLDTPLSFLVNCLENGLMN